MAIRLSVVVPVYGTAQYLPACLDSLAHQTLADCEFLLVDDASPDGAQAILQAYAAQDGRFRVLRHPQNRGLFQARLTGAEEARGDYIAFLDSDDYVSVDFYRAAVAAADALQCDVVMGDTVWLEEDGAPVVRPVHADCVMEDDLFGADIRRAFYTQELRCYSWHTVWNKIYRRDLWQKCAPWFHQLDQHVVMTEDIAFSSLLLYEAQRFHRHRGDGVFYCVHPASSTHSAQQSRQRFCKSYGNIAAVFEFVARFLRAKGDEACLAHLRHAGRWYCRMWQDLRKTCATDPKTRRLADELTERICPGFDAENQPPVDEIWWFDQQTLPWDAGLENIKRAIAGLDGAKPRFVSFDVFDTLVLRPFRHPTDLFAALEEEWLRQNRRCMLSFVKARVAAEQQARAWAAASGREEVTLSEIYQALPAVSGATRECALAMQAAEQAAEIRFCQPRRSGIQLCQLAQAMGCRVVLISDMYLDEETIRAMLDKCGVPPETTLFLSNALGKLKWNGGLYQAALDAMKVAPEQVLHVGDSVPNDVEAPRRLGIRAMHHPRTVDVLTDVRRTRLSGLGLQAARSFGSSASLSGVTMGCMQALTANRFFDNGFAATSADSFFGGSAALWGYYAVGGHLLALAQWLLGRARADGVKRLVFLARDGYLLRQAVALLLGEDSDIALDYRPASRRCLLPALTVHPSDFYALPVNVPVYTPCKLLRLLDFCTKQLPESELCAAVEAAGFQWQAPFGEQSRYAAFITWYRQNLYDGCRHQQAYNLLRSYYAPVLTEGTACFDMGYSGRLQAALSQLAGHGVPVYFVHQDGQNCDRLSRAYGFEVNCFYGLRPGLSGALREFLLSSVEPPCIGFAGNAQGEAVPVYGESEYNAPAHFVAESVQKNALCFVRDYQDTFHGTPLEAVDPYAFSLPFESALRYLTEEDLQLLSAVRFEDTVFAGRDDLSLAALVRDQAGAVNASTDMAGMQAHQPGRMVGFIPEQTPLVKRTIGFLLFDRATFKRKLKKRLRHYPRLLRAMQGTRRGLRKIAGLVKRGG